MKALTVLNSQGILRTSIFKCEVIARPSLLSKRLSAPASAFNGSRKAGVGAVRTMALFGGSAAASAASLYDIPIKTIEGKETAMDAYKGKVLLIVNVASECGFTPQYKELVDLYNRYKSKGLEIIAQPCNQFGGQEPGSNQEVKAFAGRKGATFPLLAKGDVNGGSEQPLWTYLKSKKGGILGNDIKWNFSKFLVDRQGNVVKRYASVDSPMSFEADIKALL